MHDALLGFGVRMGEFLRQDVTPPQIDPSSTVLAVTDNDYNFTCRNPSAGNRC
jgi:hypothetical protein